MKNTFTLTAEASKLGGWSGIHTKMSRTSSHNLLRRNDKRRRRLDKIRIESDK